LKYNCSKGNTVITIEHDIEIIKNADYIIEIGPEAGINGGEVIAQGSLDEIIKNNQSIITPYFTKHEKITTEKPYQQYDFIKIIGAQANNLKNITVSIPLYRLICLTGVSGSGKSSLAIEVLFKAFWSTMHNARIVPGKHTRIEGMEKIIYVYCIDQSSLSTSKTSIPATFIGVFDAIRKLFAESEDAVEKGLDHISITNSNV
jgi:excinuclease ABC subunit A